MANEFKNLSNATSQYSLRKLFSLNRVLWTVQALLALLFLFAGSVKLILPIEALTKEMQLPGLFLRFIGAAEVLGALGLILPGVLRVRPRLTPLAALGLIVIMIGATGLTAVGSHAAGAVFPLVVGLLLVFVAYNRKSSFVAA